MSRRVTRKRGINPELEKDLKNVPQPSARVTRPRITRKTVENSSAFKKRTPNVVYKTPNEVKVKYPYMEPYETGETNAVKYGENTFETEDNQREDYKMLEMEDDFKIVTYNDLHGGAHDEYDEEEEEEGEEEDNDETTLGFGNNGTPNTSAFSISEHLGRKETRATPIENLRLAVSEGSALDIGHLIREGFRTNTITEMQIEEIARNCSRPNISLFQYYRESENADKEQQMSISMGCMFLTKVAMSETKSFDKLKASVNSLSSSFAHQTKTGVLVKKSLDSAHVIEATGNFPRIDITHYYNRCNLVGDTAVSQMIQLLMRIFKNILTPNYTIWYYTFRPNCLRATDKHFLLFPDAIVEKLIDFSYDAVGINLPHTLLHGPIDVNDPFLSTLNVANKEKEVFRRRDERDNVAQTMQQSIGHMLNYIRDYHYSLESGQLENCKKRNECVDHLTWKDVKFFRMQCRKNRSDPNSFDPRHLLGFYNSLIAESIGKQASTSRQT